MHTPFPFEPFIVFGYMSAVLLIGMFLRARIKFFQRFLIPSCLIGGVIGAAINNCGISVLQVDKDLLETFAFHLFIISFISIGLTRTKEKDDETKKSKGFLKGTLWMANIFGLMLPVQAIIGGVAVLVFALFGLEVFPTFGFFAPLGFSQGPGQALSIGKVWSEEGFTHATSIGLSFAFVGYLFSFFVGVPLTSWALRKSYKGYSHKNLPEEILKGIIPAHKEKEHAGKLTTHSGNVDAFAFQLAIVGIVYLITYLVEYAVGFIVYNKVEKMLWGFFFFFGLLIALLVRFIMGKIGVGHLLDGGIQRRITGMSVDFLIISTIMAVELVVVWDFILPISIVCISTGLITSLLVIYFARRAPDYPAERMASLYGACTGTVTSGLLLLRIVDPNFKTPVALETGLMNVFASPIVLLSMLLVNSYILWNWSIWLNVLIFVGMGLLLVLPLIVFKIWGKKKF